jgi:hypothetical protein
MPPGSPRTSELANKQERQITHAAASSYHKVIRSLAAPT